MNSKIAIAVLMIIAAGLVGNVYAHKSQTIGDYKIEVGWKNEPPVVGKSNYIEIIVTKASIHDKQSKSHDNDKIKDSHDTNSTMKSHDTSKKSHAHETKNGISGLAKKLEIDVQLGGKKTVLKLVEDKKKVGHYYGKFTPLEGGSPVIHIFGKIKNTYIEATFHPEKVESMSPNVQKPKTKY